MNRWCAVVVIVAWSSLSFSITDPLALERSGRQPIDERVGVEHESPQVLGGTDWVFLFQSDGNSRVCQRAEEISETRVGNALKDLFDRRFRRMPLFVRAGRDSLVPLGFLYPLRAERSEEKSQEIFRVCWNSGSDQFFVELYRSSRDPFETALAAVGPTDELERLRLENERLRQTLAQQQEIERLRAEIQALRNQINPPQFVATPQPTPTAQANIIHTSYGPLNLRARVETAFPWQIYFNAIGEFNHAMWHTNYRGAIPPPTFGESGAQYFARTGTSVEQMREIFDRSVDASLAEARRSTQEALRVQAEGQRLNLEGARIMATYDQIRRGLYWYPPNMDDSEARRILAISEANTLYWRSNMTGSPGPYVAFPGGVQPPTPAITGRPGPPTVYPIRPR